MPDNVGRMFYFGETTWHAKGTRLDQPADAAIALEEGGLDWEVGEVKLQTLDDPPTPVSRRNALVRKDRPCAKGECLL